MAITDTSGNLDIPLSERTKPCTDECKGEATFSRPCGAWVCNTCDNHLGLARCYCGWSASGGDGRAQLVEMGETIEEDR